LVNEVYRVNVEKPGHPEQFLCIDCWQDAVISQPKWLRPYLEDTCRIMVARVAIVGVEEKQRSLYWLLRTLREYHHPMCYSIHLCHQCPVLHPCL
jgi:hypothetical protein